MARIIIEYDKLNKAALKFIELIKIIGLFKISEVEDVNTITDKALKESDSKIIKKHSNVKSVMADLNK